MTAAALFLEGAGLSTMPFMKDLTCICCEMMCRGVSSDLFTLSLPFSAGLAELP